MKILYTKDYEQMSRRAANIIAAQVTLKPESVLGLATGSTPLGLYRNLIARYNDGDLDFSRVHTVNLDEYVGLSPESDQSYAYFMKTNLFSKINVKPENTNVPDGLNPDAAAECRRYEDLVGSLGGVDLQLLGIGHNGHIGFNEPAEAFAGATNCVDLAPSTIAANARFFASASDVPKQAYTMGIKTIMNARKVLLIASGEEKAEIIDRVVTGKIEPGVPASVLQLHGDVTLVADAAALSILAKCAPQLIEGLA